MRQRYFSKESINFPDINIDLNQTAISIYNQIRAFNFREYQIPTVFNRKIISGEITNKVSKKRAGEKVFEDENKIVISTIDNELILYKDRTKELFSACRGGDFKLVKELGAIPGIVNVQNEFGWTPFIVACYNNNIEIMQLLIDLGADRNQTNFKGTTPLMYAKSAFVKTGNPSALNFLLDKEVSIWDKDYQSKTVIDYCHENEEFDAIKILLREKQ